MRHMTIPRILESADLEQWFGDYVAAFGRITTVRVVVNQDAIVRGLKTMGRVEVDIDLIGRACSMKGSWAGRLITCTVVDGAFYGEDILAGQADMSLNANMNPLLDMMDLELTAGVERQSDIIRQVELIGNEEVCGVQADHYLMTFDAAGMGDFFDDKRSWADALLVDTVMADVWLDDEMRTIRFGMVIPVEIAGTPDTLVLDITYSDYGAPVVVEAPAGWSAV